MKNAKKSLALLLALVMIFGLGTIGASAAFTDAASINPAYAEAVNVMSGMGILIGNENGDFNPTGNVTRAQAAKMVTYMILGKDAAERLPAKAMFNDVKATDWSAKFVYYLANKKIVNGYGDGNFGPNDTVTATQLAKMLLAAVGYGQAGEFVGVGWDVNVFALAVELGLYDGTKAADYDAAATREEAALYVFNAMTSITLMKYLKEDGYYDYLYTDEDTYATTKYYYDTVEGIITKVKADGNTYTELNYEGNKFYNLNIDVSSSLVGHKVNVTFKKTPTPAQDKDGIKYYNAYFVEDLSKEVSTYFAGYKAVYTAVGENYAKELAYDTNKALKPIDSYTVWLNNVNATYDTNATYKDFLGNYIAGTYGNYLSTTFSLATLLANTKLVKQSVYLTEGALIVDDDNVIIGYKANTYTVEEVKGVDTTAGAETITLSFSNGGDPISNSAKKDYVVEYDGIAKGDYVSVTKVGNVYKLEKCKLVENLHIDSYGNDVNKTINGTYLISTSSKVQNVTPAVDGTYNIYLDKMNKYARVEKVKGGISNLAFVSYLYYSNAATSTGVKEYYAKCVGADGVVTDYLITETEYDAIRGAKPAAGVIEIEQLYAFSTTTDNSYYTKKTVADFDTADADDEIVTYNQTFNSNYRIAENRPNGNYLLAADVEYIFVDTDAPKTTVSVTKTKPSNTKAYTIFFAPEQASAGSKNYNVSKIFLIGKASGTAGTSYIYSVGSDSFVYPSYIGHTAIENGKSVPYLYAFIDADYLKTLKVADTTTNFTGGYLNRGFYSYEIDSDGYYTNLKPYDGTDADDKNIVVNDKAVTGIIGDMISAGTANDVIATNAKIVDLSGYGLTTLAKIANFLEDGHTVQVSFWSYLYEEYEGTDKAVTTTIYVTKVIEKK